MFAKISWLCLLVAAGLFVWGSLCLVWSVDSRQDGRSLIVDNSAQELGEQAPGAHTLELRVRNTSNQPRRVIGMTGH